MVSTGSHKASGGTIGANGTEGAAQGVSKGSAVDATPKPASASDNDAAIDEIIVTANYRPGTNDASYLLTGGLQLADHRAPKGGEFLFIGGAGVYGRYLKGFENAFKGVGIQGVRVPNANVAEDGSWSQMLTLSADVFGVAEINDVDFAKSLVNTHSVLAAASQSRLRTY